MSRVPLSKFRGTDRMRARPVRKPSLPLQTVRHCCALQRRRTEHDSSVSRKTVPRERSARTVNMPSDQHSTPYVVIGHAQQTRHRARTLLSQPSPGRPSEILPLLRRRRITLAVRPAEFRVRGKKVWKKLVRSRIGAILAGEASGRFDAVHNKKAAIPTGQRPQAAAFFCASES